MKSKNNAFINDPNEKDFHCASFIAHILINSVETVRLFFEERKLDYKKITPSDITQIPGIKKIFSSTWLDYNKAAEQFIDFYMKLPPHTPQESQ